jgi:hypothetical protein
MNGKKFVFTAVFLIIAFTINAQEALKSSHQYDSENDFIFSILGDVNVVRIMGYSGTKAEVRIPGYIRRMPVVAIGERAFNNKGLTSVIIPNGIIQIESGAFLDNEIIQITIGSNVMLQEDSFDSGFADFYLKYGRRAGSYIQNDDIWVVYTDFLDDEDIPVDSSETAKSKTKFNIEPHGGFFFGAGLWDYGPSTLVPSLGLQLGLLANIGNFSIGIVGTGGGFFGLAYPLFKDIGITYGFYFGSFLEFYFAKLYSISLGGGMSKGFFTTKNKIGKKYFFPFAELNLMMEGDEGFSRGIFLRYYFNDSDKFYNRFSIGVKVGMIF